MVSSINNNQHNPIERVGNTLDGRVVYKIKSEDGLKTTKLSVPSNDADRFEKTYNDLTTASLIIENKNKNKKTFNKENLIFGTTLGLGLGIPLIKAKGSTLKQSLMTLGGGFLGLISGNIINSMFVPNEVKIIKKASQELSTIDIKPINI